MYKKIILGTVQFGRKYGINNSNGKINNSNRKKIFDICKRKRILSFDTAVSYKNSEDIILKNFENFNIKIYTKVNRNNFNTFSKNIKKYKNQIECIYFHNLSDYLDKNFKQKVLNFKKKNKIKKIGVSIYPTDKYLKILKFKDLDIVQLPLNILDRTFLDNGFIKKLKKRRIEVHVRSIFFQGLFAMKFTKMQLKFPFLAKQLAKIRKHLVNNRISLNELSLIWINSLKDLDKIVFGIDNSSQLIENLNILKKKKIHNSDNFINKLKYKKIKGINILKW